MEEEESAIEGLMLLWRRLHAEMQRMRATPATRLLDDVLRAMNPASELDLADRQEVYCHCDVLLVVKPFLGGNAFYLHSCVLEVGDVRCNAIMHTHLFLDCMSLCMHLLSLHVVCYPFCVSVLSALLLSALYGPWHMHLEPVRVLLLPPLRPPPPPPPPSNAPFPLHSSPCLLSLRCHLLLCSLCLISKHCCHRSSHQYTKRCTTVIANVFSLLSND